MIGKNQNLRNLLKNFKKKSKVKYIALFTSDLTDILFEYENPKDTNLYHDFADVFISGINNLEKSGIKLLEMEKTVERITLISDQKSMEKSFNILIKLLNNGLNLFIFFQNSLNYHKLYHQFTELAKEIIEYVEMYNLSILI